MEQRDENYCSGPETKDQQGSFPCKVASTGPWCNGACDLCKHVQVI